MTIVQDHLNTHHPASLDKAFEPAAARRILNRLEFCYTPKHGSWLNMAEIELRALSGQYHPIYAQFLLPTFFSDTISIASTELLIQMHVKKPLVGLEGVGVSIETGDGIAGAVHSRDARGYEREGFIIQQYQQLPEYFGYHFVVGSWILGDTPAGLVLRGDTNPITGRHCLIAPHIVSDSLLIT